MLLAGREHRFDCEVSLLEESTKTFRVYKENEDFYLNDHLVSAKPSYADYSPA